MNAFLQAINDIFKCEDFLEYCFINSEAYPCIVSTIEDGVAYTDSGMIDDVSFSILVKLPISRMPKEGDKVNFRNKNWKISAFSTDSANSALKLYLIDMSAGVGK